MPDNFDLNVAKRKPNVAGKTRPVHPWDVRNIPIDTTDVEVTEETEETPDEASVTDSHAVEEERPPVKPPERRKAPASKKPAASTASPVPAPSKKASDLSNTINIHSNFCKLDNDVSDRLFPRLSPSAQSVYLRLYRQSFGWNRNWAAESLPKLSKSCNLSLQTVRKAIKELESLDCIRREFSDYHKATVYRVLLPSESAIAKNDISDTGVSDSDRLQSDTQKTRFKTTADQNSADSFTGTQNIHGDSYLDAGGKFHTGSGVNTGGQDSVIQSVYFAGTSIYTLLESGGALPKNIHTYITDTHLANAVDTIDEFYDSIGFSVVSRAVYRKSLLDYFDLVKSGFTVDDIRYAVRWTFKNSRSRPESFSLIKHTMHLAMDDLIRELRDVSGETDLAKKKKEALERNAQWEKNAGAKNVSGEDLRVWIGVVEELKKSLNDHSFKAFIEPLKLVSVDDGKVTVSAPPDSVSWIVDHYRDVIETEYRKLSAADVTVVIE